MADSGRMRTGTALRALLRPQQGLSPALIQFYALLALPAAELEAAVAQELAENPALEADESPDPFDDPNPPWPAASVGDEVAEAISLLPAGFTLRDHLGQSLPLTCGPALQRIGRALIEEIDDDGLFRGNTAETAARLKAPEAQVEEALRAIQALTPVGVGARDLRECLLLQVRAREQEGRGHPLARALIEDQWDLFTRKRYREIARALRCRTAAVQAAADFIAHHLTPAPGRSFRAPWAGAHEASPPVRPDLVIVRAAPPGQGFEVRAFEPAPLRLRLSAAYERARQEMRQGGGWDEEARAHVAHYVRRAERFVGQLRRRQRTMVLVGREAAARQQVFLEKGRRHLVPLTRAEVARRLGFHETTVGRAVAGKYVLLPSREIVPFSLFFARSAGAAEVLAGIIAREDPRRPLSDGALARRMAEEGIPVARRTVAKYRAQLRIPPQSLRRRYGQ
jgi:RNA polymerase sigma-54 factor